MMTWNHAPTTTYYIAVFVTIYVYVYDDLDLKVPNVVLDNSKGPYALKSRYTLFLSFWTYIVIFEVIRH